MIRADWEDDRRAARSRLPRALFDYIDGGSYSEATLRDNRAALERTRLRQRVLRDVSRLDTRATLFGRELAAPLVLGPVGFAGMFSRRGEAAAARAAAAAGLRFALSTVSICPLEEVAAASSVPIWFQLYMIRDRGYMAELLARAQALGAEVLLFTVDLPVGGTRYRDQRSGFSASLPLSGRIARAVNAIGKPGWIWDVHLRGRPHHFGNIVAAIPEGQAGDFSGWIHRNFDPSVTWRDLDWVRERWGGPIVLKGVLDVEDARAAASAGAEGVVVSNHGGRQLDGAPASFDALGPVADAVGDRLTVLMDGGVRSGLDVLRALAAGADGVLIGRAWAYALAAGGEAGVSAMLRRMRSELETAMALTGLPRLADAGRDLLVEAPRAPSRATAERERA